MSTYPVLKRVRQRFASNPIADLGRAVDQQFAAQNLQDRIKPGQKVAVAVGSRGIHGIQEIVKAVIANLRGLGLDPFLMPAMGSHGRACAEGQAEVLAHLGLSEKEMGVPVVSDMTTVSLGRVASGAEVFVAQTALTADHVFVINRVKPHTAFRSEVESGLCKMLAVGCGKHAGALNMHKFDLGRTIVPAARLILEKAPILAGLALVEDSTEQTHAMRLALAKDFVATDTELLRLAKSLLPRIPTDDLDILLIEEMGKNISGAGLDPNVTGFWRRDAGPRTPDYRTLIVLDLTEESGGNAVGIGMVDLISQRLRDKVDLKATYTNALTTGIWASVRLPIALPTDQAVLDTALGRIKDPSGLRMVRIKNTLELADFWASPAVAAEWADNPLIEVMDARAEVAFDEKGALRPFPA